MDAPVGWPQAQKIGPLKPTKATPSFSSTTTNNASNDCTTRVGSRPQVTAERRARPQKDQQAINCPRCNSTNTKFCYYNNYSLNQPRHFCKACRRYWTEGGSLRNVPVGGGSRKNKRSSSSSSSSSSGTNVASAATASTSTAKEPTSIIPPKFHDQGQGLGLNQLLAFQHNGLPGITGFSVNGNVTTDVGNACPPAGALSAMELLKHGVISSSSSFGPFVSMPMVPVLDDTSAFGFKELRPPAPATLSFPFDGLRGDQATAGTNEKKLYGSIQGVQESTGDGRITANWSATGGHHFEQGSGRGGGHPPGFWISGMTSEGRSW